MNTVITEIIFSLDCSDRKNNALYILVFISVLEGQKFECRSENFRMYQVYMNNHFEYGEC